MTKLAFEEIMHRWRKYEQQLVNDIKPVKGTSCLTFAELDQFGQGIRTPEQLKHVSNCEYCQKMLRSFEAFRPNNIQRAASPKIKDSLVDLLNKFNQKTQIFLNETWRPIPVSVKFTFPVIIIAFFMFLITQTPESDLAKLARIEPVYYQEMDLRGETAQTKADQFFNEGMKFYRQKKYRQSIARLQQSIDLVPISAATCFYLGLNHLLLRQPGQAIIYLEKVFEYKGDFLYEKTCWYLGNAYLLQENPAQALEMFDKVIVLRGEYEWEARDLIDKIKQLQSTK